ncbi:hypothetical protein [Acetobacterium woodii]|uniref:Uncharacterized protein n=1 Tax=Acetobacterium woodii (strain ATCC 29683 / DSM 1030 / JCM 2381 / KCTC 1655 / WB1) TaxID=931626 RepID=H6LDF7_ACEWD|nr:hypothetical protein [Acetobacterium woodii]AFA47929.1 hypothetical protein Awo_c11450 [Acetobacterium woodii DSM 1030]
MKERIVKMVRRMRKGLGKAVQKIVFSPTLRRTNSRIAAITVLTYLFLLIVGLVEIVNTGQNNLSEIPGAMDSLLFIVYLFVFFYEFFIEGFFSRETMFMVDFPTKYFLFFIVYYLAMGFFWQVLYASIFLTAEYDVLNLFLFPVMISILSLIIDASIVIGQRRIAKMTEGVIKKMKEKQGGLNE